MGPFPIVSRSSTILLIIAANIGVPTARVSSTMTAFAILAWGASHWHWFRLCGQILLHTKLQYYRQLQTHRGNPGQDDCRDQSHRQLSNFLRRRDIWDQH